MGQLVCKCPTSTHEPDCPNRIREWHYVGTEMYRGPAREHVPCPSTAMAYLAVVSPDGALLRCGLLDDHYGPHVFHMEWTDSHAEQEGE